MLSSAVAILKVTVNSLPFSELVTSILPFIFSTKVFVIYKPKPLPWIFLVKGESTLENLLKILSISSRFIPHPLSFIFINKVLSL